MHSSTSSSNDRVPPGRWPATWIAVAAILTLVVTGWESFVRIRGLGDTAVADTAEMWVHERQRVSRLGKSAIALVGASRMQAGIDLQVMQRHAPGTPVQLAMAASPFLPVLEHLSNDDTVTGTVVVSFTMGNLVWDNDSSKAERWIAAYDDFRAGRTAVFYQPLEDTLRRGVDSVFESFRKNARPHQLIFGSTIRNHVRTLPDRSQQMDYSKVDREAAYRRRIELVSGGSEPAFRDIPDVDERFAAIEAMVRRIRGRGGEVIFVRFPSSKKIWEIDDTRYPMDVYWNCFAAQSSARTIHFADFEELADFDLPDGVHIDASDQTRFTEVLSRLLFDQSRQRLATSGEAAKPAGAKQPSGCFDQSLRARQSK